MEKEMQQYHDRIEREKELLEKERGEHEADRFKLTEKIDQLE